MMGWCSALLLEWPHACHVPTGDVLAGGTQNSPIQADLSPIGTGGGVHWD